MEQTDYEFRNRLVRWIDERLPVFTIFRRNYADHPLPRYFNKGWNLIVSVMLVIVMVSGLFVAIHYIPHEEMAFASVQNMMRDVDYGWLVRYLHMNGASFLFIATYVHMFRSMYYGSFKKPGELVWIFGVLIYILLVVCAFTGYVLTLSQMGGWAAAVITNMFTAIPFIGNDLMEMALGGTAVGTATLTRFYAVHMVLPFLVVLLVVLHVWSLRTGLAKKPLKPSHFEDPEMVMFHPYHTYKGIAWLGGFLCVFTLFTFFFPEASSPAEHFIPYDPMSMPERIIPEWYLLPLYGILRAVTFGINLYILAGLGLVVYAMLPVYAGKGIRAGKFSAMLAAGIMLCVVGYAGQLAGEDGFRYFPVPAADFYLVSAKSGGVLAMFGMLAVLFLLPWLDTHKIKAGCRRPVFKWLIWVMAASVMALGVSGYMPPEAGWVALGQVGTVLYFGWFLVALPLLSRLEPER